MSMLPNKDYNLDEAMTNSTLRQDEKETLDFESMYFFTTMRRAATAPFTVLYTFKNFTKKYRKELAATKAVLEWLGLAKHDEAAPFGWRATLQFTWLLATLPGPHDTLQPSEWPKRSTMEDTLFLGELQESALGEWPNEDTECFVNRQLAHFNLVAMDGPDDMFIVGEHLKRLVAKARQRQPTQM